MFQFQPSIRKASEKKNFVCKIEQSVEMLKAYDHRLIQLST